MKTKNVKYRPYYQPNSYTTIYYDESDFTSRNEENRRRILSRIKNYCPLDNVKLSLSFSERKVFNEFRKNAPFMFTEQSDLYPSALHHYLPLFVDIDI